MLPCMVLNRSRVPYMFEGHRKGLIMFPWDILLRKYGLGRLTPWDRLISSIISICRKNVVALTLLKSNVFMMVACRGSILLFWVRLPNKHV